MLEELVVIRHGESEYNIRRANRNNIEGYSKFSALYDKESQLWTLENIKSGEYPSAALKEMALDLLPLVQYVKSDYDTELSERGHLQALETGKELINLIEPPDIIHVSPYVRTRQTLEGLIKGWPDLANVEIREEKLISEQAYGRQGQFGDWKIFNVLHPEYALNYVNVYETKILEGESGADVVGRMRLFIESLMEDVQSPESKITEPKSSNRHVAITHHVSILGGRAYLESWTPEKFLQVNEMNRPLNCGVTHYRRPISGKHLALTDNGYNIRLYPEHLSSH